MKKTWNGELLQGLEGLAEKEERAIAGGESVWYWIGYGVGWVSSLFTSSASVQPGAQKLLHG